jgi:glycosyltransferase involved in cell wall biosynthesis
MDPVSAIMTVRDGELYIAEAIDSMLGQSAPPDEIVIVDDGSRDSTAAIVEAYGDPVRLIRLTQQDPRGQGAALNTALDVIGGELIAFLDSDDLWPLHKLELQGGALDQDPALDLVFGHVEEFISPDLTDEERAELRATDGPVPAKLRGSMLIRREAMRRAGPFSTEWKVAEFVEWYSRVHDDGLQEEMLGNVVLRRRLHRTNIGRRLKESRVEYVSVMAARLRRRRARGEI